ncbi:MAG: di-trans,poly-cis-decaprenylcistransferase [Clostridia bacterium]|nr:di-trans,poly-cis-decaprenylcistransferase [Clostridia bacterium]
MDNESIPKHIAFIMDGNGRWAKARHMPRKYGHKHGVDAMKRVIAACASIGIEIISIYAFSTENWSRPQDEIDELFKLVKRFADKELVEYAKDNYQVRFMGDLRRLPDDVRLSLDKISDAVKDNSGTIINIGLNYGSRDEIVRAVNSLISSGRDSVSVSDINAALDTCDLCDPDIIVRASGEKRLSNFMLWQAAYSEFIFIDDYWPDFTEETVNRIISEYRSRDRRYGGLKKA